MRDPSLAVLRPDALFQRRYRVARCIRAGGMGAVYEVMDERTSAPRALKIMLPGIVESADMRARFAREARITGAIESEHIVRITDAGVDEETGTPFLVMELLRGEDLGGLLARRRTLPPREVVLYLFQAALALDRTHTAGIVHRDLKPENLFVTRRDDGSPCVKILDFGIAKLAAHDGRTTRSMGTPLYMPQEQAGAKGAIGPRTDVYALGQLAYTLLAGAPYWEEEWRASEGPLGFFAEVARGVREPASARALRHGVALPTAFAGWFLKATAVRPDDRFEGAGVAVGALAGALAVPLPRSSLADGEPRTDPGAPAGQRTLRAIDSLAGAPTDALAPGTLDALAPGATDALEPDATDPLAPDARPPAVEGSGRTSAAPAGDPAPSSLSRSALALVFGGLAALLALALLAPGPSRRGSMDAVEPPAPSPRPDAAPAPPAASAPPSLGPPRAAAGAEFPASPPFHDGAASRPEPRPPAEPSTLASSTRPPAAPRAAPPPPAAPPTPAPRPPHERFF